jgi:TIR domain
MAEREPPKTTYDLFISHSSQDDAYVRELQRSLSDQGLRVCIDSRDFRPGDALEPGINTAIDESTAFAVLVSPAALQSKWVGRKSDTP